MNLKIWNELIMRNQIILNGGILNKIDEPVGSKQTNLKGKIKMIFKVIPLFVFCGLFVARYSSYSSSLSLGIIEVFSCFRTNHHTHLIFNYLQLMGSFKLRNFLFLHSTIVGYSKENFYEFIEKFLYVLLWTSMMQCIIKSNIKMWKLRSFISMEYYNVQNCMWSQGWLLSYVIMNFLEENIIGYN